MLLTLACIYRCISVIMASFSTRLSVCHLPCHDLHLCPAAKCHRQLQSRKQPGGVEKVSDVFFFLRGLQMFFGYLLGWVGGGGLKPDMMNQHSESELIAMPIHIFNILIYILTTNKPYLTHTIWVLTLTHSKPNQKHLGGSTNHGSQVKFVFCSRHPNLAR